MDKSTARALILAECKKVFSKYNAILPKQIAFESVTIDFTIRGTTAGRAQKKFGALRLLFNPQIAADNIAEFLNNTVAHEICHLFCFEIYPGAKPHGAQWQRLMQLGGYTPSRCHNMQTSNVKLNRTQNVLYTCPCGNVFTFTLTMHTRLMNGTARQRICRRCRGIVYPK